MAITVNGQTHEDGSPLTINGTQAQSVTVNGVRVWVNQYVAGAPTSFTASTTDTSTLSFAWALPANQGLPTCAYEVRDSSNAVVATVGVGVTSTSLTGGFGGTYHVVGVNAVGDSPDSNTDIGSSYDGQASPITFLTTTSTVSGTAFPANVPLTICSTGGGGGGGGAQPGDNDWYFGMGSGGGGSGSATATSIVVPHGESVAITIGAGGLGGAAGGTGGDDQGGVGGTGGTTSFGSYASCPGVPGGAGGDHLGGCPGSPGLQNGGTGGNGSCVTSRNPTQWYSAGTSSAATGCSGSYAGGQPFDNGYDSSAGGGGGGGFGAAPNCVLNTTTGPSPANSGAGGGGANATFGNTFVGAAGGSGRMIVSW